MEFSGLWVVIIMIFGVSAGALDESYHSTRPTAVHDYSRQPYALLQWDASVYRVQAERLELDPTVDEEEKVTTTRGQATMKVLSTLRGKKEQTLTLPYAFVALSPRGAKRSIYIQNIWPSPQELTPQSQWLIAVVEGPFKDDPKYSKEPRAAMATYKIDGADDLIVKDYEKMIALHDLRGKALTAGLREASKGASLLMSTYLRDAARERLQVVDSIDIVANLIMVDERRSADLLVNLAISDVAGEAGRRAALRAIFANPKSAPEMLKGMLPCLADASVYLTEKERADFAKDIRITGETSEEAKIAIDWLMGGKSAITEFQKVSDSHRYSPFFVLHKEAGVYVATVEGLGGGTKLPTTRLATQTGIATLGVVETLYGEKQEKLKLDYTYHQPKEPNDVWPALHQLPDGARFICVTLGGDEKKLVYFIPLGADADSLIQTTREMMKWNELSGQPLKSAILKAAQMKLPRVLRMLADQTAVNRLDKSDAIDVLLASIQSYLTHGVPEDNSINVAMESSALLNILSVLGPWMTSDSALQAKAFHGVIGMCGASDEELCTNGVWMVLQLLREMPQGPGELTEGERSMLGAGLKRYREYCVKRNIVDQPELLEKWLGGAK